MAPPSAPRTARDGGGLPLAVIRAMDRAESNLDQRLGLEQLADAARLSPCHFQRNFRAATGESPREFVERLRIERAALLLLAGESSITELAWEVGFRNPETFARRFHERTGITARDYRAHQLREWREFGLEPGRDPGGPGAAIRVRNLPEVAICFRRRLGEDDGFAFDAAAEPWPAAETGAPRIGVNLDWPGITPPELVRRDFAVPRTAPGRNRGLPVRLLRGGLHATIRVAGPAPVPSEVYQRLFVWAMGGRYRLRPGPSYEWCAEGEIVVCQPIDERRRCVPWSPSTGSRSTSRSPRSTGRSTTRRISPAG